MHFDLFSLCLGYLLAKMLHWLSVKSANRLEQWARKEREKEATNARTK